MTAVALALSAELLRFPVEAHRASVWMDAFSQAPAGIDLAHTRAFRGGSQWLVLWGPGGPDRFDAMRQQLQAGGRVICFDLAYWQRERKVRVSIDTAHPSEWVMRRDLSRSRFLADRVDVRDSWSPQGPIIVAGIGRKARIQYGANTVEHWEATQIAACRARWPHQRVMYRRKQADAPVPADVELTSDRPIEEVIAGASLLITWHSNVAVDAIRLGIPVVCLDGAAAAVCPSALPADLPAPLEPSLRDRFLANLAWFQWAPSEIAQCWAFLREVLA